MHVISLKVTQMPQSERLSSPPGPAHVLCFALLCFALLCFALHRERQMDMYVPLDNNLPTFRGRVTLHLSKNFEFSAGISFFLVVLFCGPNFWSAGREVFVCRSFSFLEI